MKTMQIRQLLIENFRGVSSLNWIPNQAFCCIIGSGDSGKSTILDAIEACLSSRWFSFNETDFHNCDTANTLKIEITLGELSKNLKSDARFGLSMRGWTSFNTIRDEPEGDDEPVITVRLTVDGTLEPVWELVCDRNAEGRILSNRDKLLFGLVRLSGEDARHLTWGQGSILSKLTGDNSDAAAKLAQAYSSAKRSAKLNEIPALVTTAQSAEFFAKQMGAYVNKSYTPGLELGRAGLSTGSIALHDGEVPLKLAGLGTRRLVTLAIQKSAITDGAIILIDEIEHGLEPHRIIGAISQLKSTQLAASLSHSPQGQILLTTHSDIALSECELDSIRIVRTSLTDKKTIIFSSAHAKSLQPLVRFNSRALFARRILVCEGMTEVGIILGLRTELAKRNHNKPLEQLSVAIATGNGNQSVSIATELASLGYQVALYLDSDVPLTPDAQAQLAVHNIQMFEYGFWLNTEQALFQYASDTNVQRMLNVARNNHGHTSINDSIRSKLNFLSIETIQSDFSNWRINLNATDRNNITNTLAEIAVKNRWFKEYRYGVEISDIVWSIMCDNHDAPVTKTILKIESWLYA